MAWTQRVSPQKESPEGYLLDGGAAQIPLGLAANITARGSRNPVKLPVGELLHPISRSLRGVFS